MKVNQIGKPVSFDDLNSGALFLCELSDGLRHWATKVVDAAGATLAFNCVVLDYASPQQRPRLFPSSIVKMKPVLEISNATVELPGESAQWCFGGKGHSGEILVTETRALLVANAHQDQVVTIDLRTGALIDLKPHEERMTISNWSIVWRSLDRVETLFEYKTPPVQTYEKPSVGALIRMTRS
jgi:hypothetical protein